MGVIQFLVIAEGYIMKVIKILLILLLLPIGLRAQDTTRVYCGRCIDLTAKNKWGGWDGDKYDKVEWQGGKLWGYQWTTCGYLSINCRLQCIDGDLYRICEDEDWTIQGIKAKWYYADSDSLTDKYKHSIKEAVIDGMNEFYNRPVMIGLGYSQNPDSVAAILRDLQKAFNSIYLDTIQVCDTSKWFMCWFDESWCDYPEGYGSTAMSDCKCYDSKIIYKDSTWQNECGLYCSKSWYACIVCQDSIVQRRK